MVPKDRVYFGCCPVRTQFKWSTWERWHSTYLHRKSSPKTLWQWPWMACAILERLTPWWPLLRLKMQRTLQGCYLLFISLKGLDHERILYSFIQQTSSRHDTPKHVGLAYATGNTSGKRGDRSLDARAFGFCHSCLVCSSTFTFLQFILL